MSHTSLGGANYNILIKSDCTSYVFVGFLKAKSDAMMFLIKILRSIKRITCDCVKTLRMKSRIFFCNDEFELLLDQEGITCKTNTSYTPQQNGYIECNLIDEL